VQSPRSSRCVYPADIDAKTIYFVRHGQTEWNAAARMQGQQDSDLNDLGRRQAEDHGRLLARVGVDALYVSPLNRARQTLAIVQRFVSLDARADDRIKEWNCGLWSGQLRADVRKRWPREWAALEADPYRYRGPGCENYPDMIARSRPFVDELLASPARRIAVISHGMIGRVMVGILLGFDEHGMLAFKQPNDVVYRVRLPGPGGASLLDRFESGSGPFDGVVRR
jgi:broad specificity phosphatase PhoE